MFSTIRQNVSLYSNCSSSIYFCPNCVGTKCKCDIVGKLLQQYATSNRLFSCSKLNGIFEVKGCLYANYFDYVLVRLAIDTACQSDNCSFCKRWWPKQNRCAITTGFVELCCCGQAQCRYLVQPSRHRPLSERSRTYGAQHHRSVFRLSLL